MTSIVLFSASTIRTLAYTVQWTWVPAVDNRASGTRVELLLQSYRRALYHIDNTSTLDAVCRCFKSQSTILQSCLDVFVSSTKQNIKFHAQGHNTVSPVSLEQATLQSHKRATALTNLLLLMVMMMMIIMIIIVMVIIIRFDN